MRIRFGAHGRLEVPAHRIATALLTILLLIAVDGCGARHDEQASVASPGEDQSSASGSATSSAQAAVAENGGTPATRRAGIVHRITLTDRCCIRFEPQWTSVHVGQSVSWHSELKSPIRIYVSPGVFDRMSFLVRPGATVNTGPARSVGRFSFWTEPSACRDMPRGVLLAGPGVRVRETFYASAPGIR